VSERPDTSVPTALPEHVRWPVEAYYPSSTRIEVASPPRHQQRVWLHVLLLVLTVATTTLVGWEHYTSFLAQFRPTPPPFQLSQLVAGLWYSGTILAILGCHEMGHYLACRYYDVDASWPYFLPLPPLLFLTGTLGAFIRIREPIRAKKVLFDVGVAGPLAGFAVALPAVFLGFWLSNTAPLPKDFSGLELGEPLLFKLAAWLVWGTQPAGQAVNIHPVAFAAWFGLLATALNLFPIGQLDGGHISYAVFGRRSFYISLAAVGCAALLTQISVSWYFFTALMIVMLFVFGPRHPPTLDEHVPLDPGRKAIAALALVIFILSFTPVPIEVIELLPK
jgi:membrane-associated protease RseP (regulator of RpoE activity)